ITMLLPLSVRSTSTTCELLLALSTPCTTTPRGVCGTVTSPRSQPSTASTSTSRLERNRHSRRRQKRKLRHRRARRRTCCIIKEVEKNVLRVEGVDETHVGRDRGAPPPEVARRAQ